MKKRIVKYVVILTTIIFLLYGIIVLFFGGIDIKGTFDTKYTKIENSDYQIIQTKFFRIKTPLSWVHIFGGFGIEANPYGGFITPKGIISYEIGPWAPDYEIDSIWTFSGRVDTINMLVVTTGLNKTQDEIGISVSNMEGGLNLTFYMSGAVKRNYNDIVFGLSEYRNY